MLHAHLPPYFLLDFFALWCSHTSDQSRRKNVLSVFYPLLLRSLHPNNPAGHMSSQAGAGGSVLEGERKWGRVGMYTV